jgi:HPt (histidine-containing phosphotransfer) domain-containing protein
MGVCSAIGYSAFLVNVNVVVTHHLLHFKKHGCSMKPAGVLMLDLLRGAVMICALELKRSCQEDGLDNRMDDDAILVEINGELEPLIPLYLDNVRDDCRMLEELLEKGDLKEIENMGHRLKGSGGSCGFDTISEAGKTIEFAAETQDRDSIALACRALKSYLEQVRVVYV